ncbi:ATP-binding cassette domain-containing protein [Mucilaginibacter psychrotolerans]|uniref:ABC transporter ATP-binding protein n=1 Tax=Mucilaginibacter psychrotolerans TaxID=1524096 RepID=A0A4Y8SGL9_9SPHI|nr:ABC transporter ATP-binding protein [Mucilaginibacter psychrotolerans]TFF38223.1 ABC transporter ATP-binding protein [Mucilaginibacter psychrotolerans]
MKRIIKSIFLILSPQEKGRLHWLIAFDVLVALLDIAFLGALLLIINFYTQASGSSKLNWLPPQLADRESLLLIGIFLLLFALKNVLGFVVQKAQHHFFYAVASRLSKRNMLNYLRGSYTQYIHTDSSVQTRRISHQPIEFGHHILTNFQQMICQAVLIIFTIAAILFYHPSLFLILFVLLLPPVSLLAWFGRRKLRALRGRIKAASARSIKHVNEALAGYVESRIYEKEDFFSNRYVADQQQLNNTIAAQQTWQGLPSRLMEVFAVMGFFILIAVNKYTANAPAVNLLTIGVFMAAAYKVIPGIVKIMNSAGQMKTYEFILADLINGTEEEAQLSGTSTVETIRSVEFDSVDFNYKEHAIIHDISFRLTRGDMVGISAGSGRGKTTMINLLLGFLQQDAGEICINNTVCDAAARQGYQHKISYVKQQPFLINESVLKNITLTDDDFDEDRLRYVIAFCGLDSLLKAYPGGICKLISQDGKNISGGQRQRLMLARALYHHFDLLILDEPFSELDAEAEHELLTNLQGLARQGKIIILITHNRTSLEFCSQVISLDEAYA